MDAILYRDGVVYQPSGSSLGGLNENAYTEQGKKAEAAATSGTKTDVLIAHTTAATPGILYRDFADLWYGHVHVLPGRVNAGNMVSSQTREIEVFNGRFASVSLDSIGGAVSGCTLDGDPTPRTFAALESYFYELKIAASGDLNFDGSFSFVFSTGEAPALRITGARVLAFPFRHNFDVDYLDRISFLTDVLEARSGKEQRIGLIANPRRVWEQNAYMVDKDERARFRALLRAWQHQPFAVPFWPDQTRLLDGISAGASSLNVSTVGRDFDDGAYVMLWYDSTTFEVIEIDSLTSTSIALKNPTTRAWAAGRTRVIPCRLAQLPLEMTVNPLLLSADAATIGWRLLVSNKSINRLGSGTFTSYRGAEVWSHISDESGGLSEDINIKAADLDAQIGYFRTIKKGVASRWTHDHRHVMKNRAAVADFIAFLYRRMGRLTPVWVVSWAKDFELKQPIVSAGSTIVVKSFGYANLLAGQQGARDIAIIYRGTRAMEFKQIIDAVDNNDGTESLTLDSAFSTDHQIAEIERISFLRPCRIESDSVDILYPHSGYAASQFRFTELLTAN